MTIGQSKGSILVVDDEDAVRKAVCQILRKDDYDVVGASSGQDAIRMISQGSFDVAILDIRMPEMSGFDVMHVMKKVCPDTIVIILTAVPDPASQFASQAKSATPFAYLTKPCKLRDLRDTLARAFSQKRAPPDSVPETDRRGILSGVVKNEERNDTLQEEELSLEERFVGGLWGEDVENVIGYVIADGVSPTLSFFRFQVEPEQRMMPDYLVITIIRSDEVENRFLIGRVIKSPEEDSVCCDIEVMEEAVTGIVKPPQDIARPGAPVFLAPQRIVWQLRTGLTLTYPNPLF